MLTSCTSSQYISDTREWRSTSSGTFGHLNRKRSPQKWYQLKTTAASIIGNKLSGEDHCCEQLSSRALIKGWNENFLKENQDILEIILPVLNFYSRNNSFSHSEMQTGYLNYTGLNLVFLCRGQIFIYLFILNFSSYEFNILIIKQVHSLLKCCRYRLRLYTVCPTVVGVLMKPHDSPDLSERKCAAACRTIPQQS